ncbi:MAG: AraC family transcriptional regulator [Ferruginibacter sp.]
MKPAFENINAGNASFLVRKFEEKNFAAPYHFHPEYELTLILEGTGKRYVGTNMNDYYPNDLVLLGANLPHCWKTEISANDGMSGSIVIQFLTDFMGNDFLQKPELNHILQLLNRSMHGIHFTGNTNLCKQKMIALTNEQSSFRRLVLTLEILEELAVMEQYTLLNNQPVYTGLPQVEKERMNAVIAYIVENFQDKVTLQHAAATANMTPHAFCKYFKKINRKTFIEAVIDYRIEYAIKELVNTDKPVEQIGFDSGFNDISNFYKTFKDRIKMSPLNYRNSFMKQLQHS